MIYDLEAVANLPESSAYDVCIAGGGVAGITLATSLIAKNVRVLLLEAGGLEYTPESQDVYQGAVLGRSYFPLEDSRLRFLGGTSNHWTGRCRPLDPADFLERDYIDHSGWPISRASLDPYLERASEILEISSDYDDRPVASSRGQIQHTEFKRSPPVRFGAKYLETLKRSDLVDLVVNANLVDLHLTDDADHVSSFECVNYTARAKRHSFSAGRYVLAMGGIENPRMMLNFTHNSPQGVGNSNDLVGRYFMDHFHVQGGYYITNKHFWSEAPLEKTILGITASHARDTGIGQASLRMGAAPKERGLKDSVKDVLCEYEIIEDFAKQFTEFVCPQDAKTAGSIKVTSEQVPNRDSRVVLTPQMDDFGLRRAGLDWRATELDRKTIRESMLTLAEHFLHNDLGNVKLVDWLLETDADIPAVGEGEWQGAGFHHMGTTRMGASPAEGVVDKDCRVFGIDNLYVAGSSVFTTSGHANPTLTLVQLALRLADHLGGAARA